MTLNKDVFLVPWGSESICMWCKKDKKCLLFKKEGLKKSEHSLIKAFWSAAHFAQIIRCPLDEFEPNEEKNPYITRGKKIKLRYPS